MSGRERLCMRKYAGKRGRVSGKAQGGEETRKVGIDEGKGVLRTEDLGDWENWGDDCNWEQRTSVAWGEASRDN
jgi:hypothetical protein